MIDVSGAFDTIVKLALPEGGWGYYSGQALHFEPTCLATLALTADGDTHRPQIDRALTALDTQCDSSGLYRLDRGAFAYLFLVTDLFARHIVGWHLSRDLSHYAALRALDAAQRTLGRCTGIVHHSDRGSQYCCHDYLAQLHALRMIPSMTDAAHCYQNAVAERVNGILKAEFDLDAVFPSFRAAQHAVTQAVHIYNTIRTHWSLQLRTPHTVFHRAA